MGVGAKQDGEAGGGGEKRGEEIEKGEGLQVQGVTLSRDLVHILGLHVRCDVQQK